MCAASAARQARATELAAEVTTLEGTVTTLEAAASGVEEQVAARTAEAAAAAAAAEAAAAAATMLDKRWLSFSISLYAASLSAKCSLLRASSVGGAASPSPANTDSSVEPSGH